MRPARPGRWRTSSPKNCSSPVSAPATSNLPDPQTIAKGRTCVSHPELRSRNRCPTTDFMPEVRHSGSGDFRQSESGTWASSPRLHLGNARRTISTPERACDNYPRARRQTGQVFVITHDSLPVTLVRWIRWTTAGVDHYFRSAPIDAREVAGALYIEPRSCYKYSHRCAAWSHT